jgi:phospholipid transport system substrate-binding protein
MKRRSALVGLLAACALWLTPVNDAGAQDARTFIAALGQQAIQVLGPGVPEAQRLAQFRVLFHNDFDVPGIGRFVLGRYWRVATPQEQQEFLGLFQEYIVRAYSARLGEYAGEPFSVSGARPAGDQILVSSAIARPSGPVVVDWYLANRGGRLLITDVYVGGISMAVTQRDEFASVIQRNGGSVAGLIAQLRQKLGAG